jgi:hypothetical protein
LSDEKKAPEQPGQENPAQENPEGQAAQMRIPFYCFSGGQAKIDEFAKKFPEEEPRIEIILLANLNDILAECQRRGGGTALLAMPDEKAAAAVFEILRILKATINLGFLRVVVVSASRNATLIERLTRLGVAEILPMDFTLRSLQFKMRKVVDVNFKKFHGDDSKKADQDKGQGKKKNKGSAAGPVASGPAKGQIEFISPVDEKGADCWLNKGGGAIKVMNRWNVRLQGPSPIAGKWIPFQPKGADGARRGPEKSRENVWEWQPMETEKFPFVTEPGLWIAEGDPPVWVTDKWKFTGRMPSLTFWSGAELKYTRFAGDTGGGMKIARESAGALAKAPMIAESVKIQMRIAQEKAAQEETSDPGSKPKSKTDAPPGAASEVEADAEAEGAEEGVSFGESGGDLKEISPKKKRQDKSLPEGPEDTTEPVGVRRSGESGSASQKGDSGPPSESFVEPSDDPSDVARATKKRASTESSSDFKFQEEKRESREYSGRIKQDEVKDLVGRSKAEKTESKDLTGRFKAEESKDLTGKFKKEKGESKDLAGKFEKEPEKSPLKAPPVIPDADRPKLEAKFKEIELAAKPAKIFQSLRERKGGKITPRDPALPPIAVALLVSELLTNLKIPENEVAGRFTRVLSQAIGGLDVSIWKFLENNWTCVGTSSEKTPTEVPTPVRIAAQEGKKTWEVTEARIGIVALQDKSAFVVVTGESVNEIPADYMGLVAELSAPIAA